VNKPAGARPSDANVGGCAVRWPRSPRLKVGGVVTKGPPSFRLAHPRPRSDRGRIPGQRAVVAAGALSQCGYRWHDTIIRRAAVPDALACYFPLKIPVMPARGESPDRPNGVMLSIDAMRGRRYTGSCLLTVREFSLAHRSPGSASSLPARTQRASCPRSQSSHRLCALTNSRWHATSIDHRTTDV